MECNEAESNQSDYWNLRSCEPVHICKCPDVAKLVPLGRTGEKCLKRDLTYTIGKLCELTSDPVTNTNVPRICRLLNDFVYLTGNEGYYIRDLESIMQVLEFLAWRARDVREYQQYLDRMLQSCCIPPLLEKTSEGLFCAEVLEQYFTLLGYLLVILPTMAEILVVHEALHRLLARSKPANIAAVKLELCHRAAENSTLPVTITAILEIASPEIFPKMLDLTFLLVSVSYKCCYRLMEAGVLNHLLIRLDPNHATRDPTSPPPEIPEEQLGKDDNYVMLVQVTNIMWGLMRSILPPRKYPKCMRDIPCLTQCAMWSLRYAFKREVRCCQRNSKSVMMRNDLAALMLAGLVALPSWKLVECGLADDLAILAVATEIGMEGTWAEKVNFTTTNEDLRFKKILLMVMCHIVKIGASISIMIDRKVLVAVLQLINPGITDLYMRWNPTQFWDLTQYALRTLTILLPRMPYEFIRHKGAIRFLMIIEWCMVVEFDVRLVLNCTKTLDSIIVAGRSIIQDEFREHGGIAVLMKLVHHILTFNVLTMQHQRILTHVLASLEIFIKNRKHYEELYGEQSVKIALRLLNRCVSQKTEDFKVDDRLLIAAGMFVWECIVMCPMNVDAFVERGGTYLMLDVIDSNIFPVRVVFLGALCDMCEESRCGPHIGTWRGRNKNIGVLSLLTRCWREEEIMIGVKRTVDGCIDDFELPLMGTDQWFITYYLRKSDHSSSPTILDMIASSRPKIFGIRKIIEREIARYTMSKERYKIFLHEPSTEDNITMQIIDHFFRLKQGQIWIEVNRDLEQIGVTPLGIDGQMIFLMIQRHHRRSVYIKSKQEAILMAAWKEELKKEKDVVTRLRESKLAPSLDAFQEVDYIGRTTNREYLMERKDRQRQQVNAALAFPPDTDAEHCHRTFYDKTNVTATMGQNLLIRSVKMQDADFGRRKLLPVSPSSSEIQASPSRSLYAETEELRPCRTCFLTGLPCFHYPQHPWSSSRRSHP